MNREILFRGKRVDNGKWVKGNLYELRIDNSQRVAIQGWSVNEVIAETVSQYTGLKDKNGVKIFEGDILENFAIRDYVLFDEGQFRLSRDRSNVPFTAHFGIEVSGNIFDNPELLKGRE